MKKTTQLRNMILSNELEFIMEAHSGMSAKIVEETGFKGIWGSGLSISAAMGVRDNNEASWTQVLEVLEFMSDATTIPILLDGDTGYGNFNNMRRLIKKLEQRNIGGVCIEDKLFPKTNSFIGGEAQPLADIDEFSGKLKAAKDTQMDDDFVVVARIEAFIAGWGLSEALRRAEEYRKAGADALLVHSKKSEPSDIEMFMKEWGDRHPIVIVPTKYYSTPTKRFSELGISLAIWANHNMRASVQAIKECSRKIYEAQSLITVEDNVVPVSEIFRLQGAEELKEAEKIYLPTSGKSVNSIVLAASQGSLGELTKDIPKTLLKVNNKTILATQIEQFNHVGIKDISVVRGFAKDKVVASNIKTIDNNDFEGSKELYSLNLAKDQLAENTLISFGDIVFRKYILNDLLNDDNDITIIVDADHKVEENYDPRSNKQYFVGASHPYSRALYDQTVSMVEISTSLNKDKVHGEFIGLWKVNKNGARIVKETMAHLEQKDNFKEMTLCDLFTEIAKNHPIAVKYIKGYWLDINTIVDLQNAGTIF